MDITEALAHLDHFRRTVYDRVLGLRKDTTFELMEAVLVADGPANLVHLSLEPVFRRRWSSAPDAISQGSLDQAQLRHLFVTQLAQQPSFARPVWVGDGTVWPRPAASTSCDLTWAHRPNPGKPQHGIVPGWEYQWLAQVPQPPSSWALPLSVDRRGPGAASPTVLVIGQIRAVNAQRAPDAPRPIALLDSKFDVVDLGRAVHDQAEPLGADVLVRLPRRRRFFAKPPPYSGKGAPRRHGPMFNLKKPETWWAPDQSASYLDPQRGQVQVDVWEQLHDQHDYKLSFCLVRVQLERLPKSTKRPEPLWLVWIGLEPLADILDYWRLYQQRFVIEHAFRFIKQDLGWTKVRPMHPEAADTWTWLIAIILWQLWLARSLTGDQRLPWERACPEARPSPNLAEATPEERAAWEQACPEARLSPGRVRRGMARVIARVGTPSRAVQPRGKSPGRALGQCPGPHKRHPPNYRRPKRAA